jgi:predicted RNA binding protein with dsRBD fold (UPF0201 family)
VVHVTVTAPVKATEDSAQVEAAMRRLFPDLQLAAKSGNLAGTTQDLRPLRQRVWELQIIDTFRGQFLHGAPSTTAKATTFRLSKQAAHAGKVSFPPTPHALGDLKIQVALQDNDPFATIEEFAYWLCPETKDGAIVGPILP